MLWDGVLCSSFVLGECLLRKEKSQKRWSLIRTYLGICRIAWFLFVYIVYIEVPRPQIGGRQRGCSCSVANDKPPKAKPFPIQYSLFDSQSSHRLIEPRRAAHLTGNGSGKRTLSIKYEMKLNLARIKETQKSYPGALLESRLQLAAVRNNLKGI